MIGIASQVENAVIISNIEEAEAFRKTKKAGIVSQSTQTIENVQEIINILNFLFDNDKVGKYGNKYQWKG